MNQVTISAKEYSQLRKRASAYQKLMSKFYEAAIKDPVDEIMKDFRKTGLYTRMFLRDLEDGLRKSSYARR